MFQLIRSGTELPGKADLASPPGRVLVSGVEAPARTGPAEEIRDTAGAGIERPPRAIRDATFQDLTPLWMAGLSALVFLSVYLLFGGMPGLLPRKLHEWLLYGSFALSFALALGFAWKVRGEHSIRTWEWQLLLGLSAASVVGAAYLLLVTGRWLAVLLAAVQTVGVALIVSQRERLSQRQVVCLAMAATLGWIAALALGWWEPLRSTLREPAGVLLLAFASLAMTWWAVAPVPLRGKQFATSRLTVWGNRVLDIAAFVVVGLFAIRTDGLITAAEPAGTLHHWGTFVGPAQQVRDGGWLLWDVPSLYGYLMILVIAFAPIDSAWQALYVVNAAALLVTGAAVYWVVRAVHLTAMGKVVALAVTLPAVFVHALWEPTFIPIHVYPNLGPFRFVWCYALIAVLVLALQRGPGTRGRVVALALGHLCWLCGVLWSFESAAICTAMWLPAYVAIIVSDWRSQPEIDGNRANARWRLAGWLGLPIALLVVTLGGVYAFYLVRLGHAPDLISFVEFVLTFGSGEASADRLTEQAAVDFAGSPMAVVLVLLVVGASAAILLRQHPPARELPLLLALGAAVWVISTYYVARPLPESVFRSLPAMIVALSLSIVALTRHVSWRRTVVIRSLAVPFVTMLLVLTYTNGAGIRATMSRLASFDPPPSDVAAGLQAVAPELQELIEIAGVRPEDRIVFDGSPGGDMMKQWTSIDGAQGMTDTRSWLPAPLTPLSFVPESRAQIYLARMTDRLEVGGWYVHAADDRELVYGDRWWGGGQWFFDQLGRTHVPTRSYQNSEWQIVWFEYVGDQADVARPVYLSGELHEAPRQLRINGVPVNQSPGTEIWMIPAEGWHQQREQGTLTLSFPARMFVYSDSAQDASIVLVGPRGHEPPDLMLRCGGESCGSMDRTSRNSVSAELTLAEGWNEIVVEPSGASPAERGAVEQVWPVERISLSTLSP